MSDHLRYMRVALSLARRHLGQTWPNPSVGAIIVKDGRIVGAGVTARGGRPHAETQAIEDAGAHAKGATLYVTLEPCSHHGGTPPCADAVIAAGITDIIAACRDPNPQVSGRGIERLKQAGITVIEGIGADEARDINRGFFSVMEKARPFIALKFATSLDGKVADATGKSQWITGEQARTFGHLLRARHDAIATGIGTVLADDPLLTCRLPELEDASPVRVVFDSSLKLPMDSRLVKTAKQTPVWVMTSPSSRRRPGSTPSHKLEEAGVKIVESMDPGLRRDEGTELSEFIKIISSQGITRLLVEAGPRLSTAFLQSGLVDRIYWFRAPLAMGAGGLDAVSGGFSQALAQLPRWRMTQQRNLGPDTLDVLDFLGNSLR